MGPAALDAVASEAAQVSTGLFSCAGLAWQEDEDGNYDVFGTLRYFVAGPGQFACNAVLPNGATVTAVRFSVHDSSNSEQVDFCKLSRVDVVPPAGTEEQLAGPVGTTDTFMGGDSVIEDTSIANAIVDNDDFSHFPCLQHPGERDRCGDLRRGGRVRTDRGAGGLQLARAPFA